MSTDPDIFYRHLRDKNRPFDWAKYQKLTEEIMTAGQMDCCIACDTTEPFSMSGQASAVSSSDRNFNIGLCPKCRADLELGRKVRLKSEEENTRVAELETELNGLFKAIPEAFQTRVMEGGGPEDIVKSAVLSVFRLKDGYAELERELADSRHQEAAAKEMSRGYNLSLQAQQREIDALKRELAEAREGTREGKDCKHYDEINFEYESTPESISCNLNHEHGGYVCSEMCPCNRWAKKGGEG